MLVTEHTVKTKASPKIIWEIYKDFSSLNKWDHEIEYSQLDGEFADGTKGTLKPKNGPLVKFIMAEVEHSKKFVDISFLPFTKMFFIHILEEKNGFTFITHRVEMTGFLSPLFAFIIGRGIRESMHGAMDNLVKLAEKQCQK